MACQRLHRCQQRLLWRRRRSPMKAAVHLRRATRHRRRQVGSRQALRRQPPLLALLASLRSRM